MFLYIYIWLRMCYFGVVFVEVYVCLFGGVFFLFLYVAGAFPLLAVWLPGECSGCARSKGIGVGL